MKQLDPGTRELLELVSSAVFANPFTDERIELDLRISGVSREAHPQERLGATLANVRSVLAAVLKSGTTVRSYQEPDRGLLRYALLFSIFHRHMPAFDDLIRKQIKAGTERCAVPFSAEAMSALTEAGLSGTEAARIFALFYQLRRAYFFIDSSLIGCSRSMKELRRALWDNVFTHDIGLYERFLWSRMEDFSTLLLGETGTGKGAAAAAIGRSGFIPLDERHGCFAESFTGSFVSINLSQFPESLIESELFGHRKGAFTGAIEAHEGILSRCSPHGSIFIDEIGEVAVPVQIKLLQVLQERTFSPVGSHTTERFRGRVIAATNRREEDLRGGHFRDDFFYRLSSDVITVPPLRIRIREDTRELSDLVAFLVQRTVGEPSEELNDLVLGVIRSDLSSHTWPGNVRELEQCVRRVLLTRHYDPQVTPESRTVIQSMFDKIEAEDYTAGELLAAYCALLYERHGTYEAVAQRTGLDRRTAKKHVLACNRCD